MKVNADQKLPIYQVINTKLLIHLNEQIVKKEDMEYCEIMSYEYNEARCNVYDDRSILIQKIINSVYDTSSEIALINNKEEKPEAYAEYQAFRVEAKALADGWIAKKG